MSLGSKLPFKYYKYIIYDCKDNEKTKIHTIIYNISTYIITN